MGEYLDDQLEWSADVVARSGGKVEETPILLFATAGLRMMKPSDAEEVRARRTRTREARGRVRSEKRGEEDRTLRETGRETRAHEKVGKRR